MALKRLSFTIFNNETKIGKRMKVFHAKKQKQNVNEKKGWKKNTPTQRQIIKHKNVAVDEQTVRNNDQHLFKHFYRADFFFHSSSISDVRRCSRFSTVLRIIIFSHLFFDVRPNIYCFNSDGLHETWIITCETLTNHPKNCTKLPNYQSLIQSLPTDRT